MTNSVSAYPIPNGGGSDYALARQQPLMARRGSGPRPHAQEGARLALQLRKAIRGGLALREHHKLKLMPCRRPLASRNVNTFPARTARIIEGCTRPAALLQSELQLQLEHESLLAACREHVPARRLSPVILTADNFDVEVESLADHCRDAGLDHCTAWLRTPLEFGQNHWIPVVVMPDSQQVHLVDNQPDDPLSQQSLRVLHERMTNAGMRVHVHTLPGRIGRDSTEGATQFIREVHQLVLPANQSLRAEEFKILTADGEKLSHLRLAPTFLSVTFHSPFARVLADLVEHASRGNTGLVWIHSIDSTGNNRWMTLTAKGGDDGITHWHVEADDDPDAGDRLEELKVRMRHAGAAVGKSNFHVDQAEFQDAPRNMDWAVGSQSDASPRAAGGSWSSLIDSDSSVDYV